MYLNRRYWASITAGYGRRWKSRLPLVIWPWCRIFCRLWCAIGPHKYTVSKHAMYRGYDSNGLPPLRLKWSVEAEAAVLPRLTMVVNDRQRLSAVNYQSEAAADLGEGKLLPMIAAPHGFWRNLLLKLVICRNHIYLILNKTRNGDSVLECMHWFRHRGVELKEKENKNPWRNGCFEAVEWKIRGLSSHSFNRHGPF